MGQEQMATAAWAAVGLLAAILLAVGGLFGALHYGNKVVNKGLREDVAYHQRQLTDLRTILAGERDECEQRIARLAARVEVLERGAGMRD